MLGIRIFGWVIIAINAYFVYAFSKGVIELSADGSGDAAIGIYAFMSMIIWAVLNIILYVLYRVTGRKKRECPACARNVKKGLTICPSCNFDFARAAGTPVQE